jgi:hypothetical protein
MKRLPRATLKQGEKQFFKWKGKWKKVGSGKEKRERWEGRMKVVE